MKWGALKMHDYKNITPYLELCLCHKCASMYFNDPSYWIEKSEPYQEITEVCDFCKSSNGIDYNIWKVSTISSVRSCDCGGERK